MCSMCDDETRASAAHEAALVEDDPPRVCPCSGSYCERDFCEDYGCRLKAEGYPVKFKDLDTDGAHHGRR